MIFGKNNQRWQKFKYQIEDPIIGWTLVAGVGFSLVCCLICLIQVHKETRTDVHIPGIPKYIGDI